MHIILNIFRLWSPNNPHFHGEEPLHDERLTVWGGFCYEGVIGPFYWQKDPQFPNEKGITARWFKAMLEQGAIPAMRGYPQFENMWVLMDGAPAHYSNSVLEVMDTNFPGRWVGRGTADHPAPIQWPPRSPDLAPNDYFLWGWMKSQIYTAEPIPDLATLRRKINETFARIDRDMIRRAIDNFKTRLEKCVANNGRSVEV